MHLETRPLLPLSLGFCISPNFSGCPAQDAGPLAHLPRHLCLHSGCLALTGSPSRLPFLAFLGFPVSATGHFLKTSTVPENWGSQFWSHHLPSLCHVAGFVLAQFPIGKWNSRDPDEHIHLRRHGGKRCMYWSFFFLNVTFFKSMFKLINIFLWRRKMCRLHFTFCIIFLYVCVSVFWCLYHQSGKYSPWHGHCEVELRKWYDLGVGLWILISLCIWTLEFWGPGHCEDRDLTQDSYASNFAHLPLKTGNKTKPEKMQNWNFLQYYER